MDFHLIIFYFLGFLTCFQSKGIFAEKSYEKEKVVEAINSERVIDNYINEFHNRVEKEIYQKPKLEDRYINELNTELEECEKQNLDPDTYLTTIEFVKKYGYIGEIHHVTTDDGYILEMHRITGTRQAPSSTGKPVVLIMHGLLSSSVDWVVSGTDAGLAYVMSDAGYDVWLGNARGNFYSRRHMNYTTENKKFWDFSWHEIGVYDLPAMIDFIVEKTGQPKIFYVGHSQGTTSFFVMGSERPEYQEKITAMFALAPVAYASNLFSPVLRFLAPFGNQIAVAIKLIGQYEFEPTDEITRKWAALVCNKNAITQPVCSNVLFLIAGYDCDQLDKNKLPIILSHVPSGSSVDQVLHYAQLINSGHFRKFDYGWIENLSKYGKISPPDYNLKKIKIPVILHYSNNDWLSDPKDVDKLYRQLGSPYAKLLVPHPKFNHLDYLWALNANELLYTKMISIMTRFK